MYAVWLRRPRDKDGAGVCGRVWHFPYSNKSFHKSWQAPGVAISLSSGHFSVPLRELVNTLGHLHILYGYKELKVHP